MLDLKNINFMSNNRYDDLIETKGDELYAVELYDFTVSLRYPVASQTYAIDLPKTINPKNYFVNAYFYVNNPVGNFVKGDVIPLSQAWGNAYRNLGYWLSDTQIGFPTSDQISVINKNTSGTTLNIAGNYTTVYFDFYKLR